MHQIVNKTVKMKKVRPNDGCLCFSSRCLVLSTGCFSAVLSLLVILPCVFVLVSSQAWNLGRQAVKQWLQENHGDKKVTLILIFLYETLPYTNTYRSMMLLEHVLTGWTGTTRRCWLESSSPQLSIFSSLSCWFSAPCFTSGCSSYLGW